ncbi:hypothetical protein ACI2KR_21130 [Pseudomonas luteola]
MIWVDSALLVVLLKPDSEVFMEKEVSYRWYVLTLAALFGVIWALLAVSPVKRGDWLMENLLVVAFVITLAAGHRHFLFSRTSLTLIFFFLYLYEVGLITPMPRFPITFGGMP